MIYYCIIILILLSLGMGCIENARGDKLATYTWRPPGHPRGLVFLSHGYAEHLGYYEDLAVLLRDQGYLVFGHDHVGFGRSGGDWGGAVDYQYYIDDIVQHVEQQAKYHPRHPLFLVGYAMGATVAVLASQQRPELFSGAVLNSVITEPPESAAAMIKLVGLTLGKIAPRVGYTSPNFASISRNESFVAAIQADPLYYSAQTQAGTAREYLRVVQALRASRAEVTVPLLLLHGTQCALHPLQSAQELYDSVASSDKTLKKFQNAYCNVFQELDAVRTQAMQDALAWITDHDTKWGGYGYHLIG